MTLDELLVGNLHQALCLHDPAAKYPEKLCVAEISEEVLMHSDMTAAQRDEVWLDFIKRCLPAWSQGHENSLTKIEVLDAIWLQHRDHLVLQFDLRINWLE